MSSDHSSERINFQERSEPEPDIVFSHSVSRSGCGGLDHSAVQGPQRGMDIAVLLSSAQPDRVPVALCEGPWHEMATVLL